MIENVRQLVVCPIVLGIGIEIKKTKINLELLAKTLMCSLEIISLNLGRDIAIDLPLESNAINNAIYYFNHFIFAIILFIKSNTRSLLRKSYYVIYL